MDQENEYRTDDERPGDLQEPALSWEDLEAGKPSQLALFTPFPTIAERAFLALARKWYADVQANTYIFWSADILALSCLLLAWNGRLSLLTWPGNRWRPTEKQRRPTVMHHGIINFLGNFAKSHS